MSNLTLNLTEAQNELMRSFFDGLTGAGGVATKPPPPPSPTSIGAKVIEASSNQPKTLVSEDYESAFPFLANRQTHGMPARLWHK